MYLVFQGGGRGVRLATRLFRGMNTREAIVFFRFSFLYTIFITILDNMQAGNRERLDQNLRCAGF